MKRIGPLALVCCALVSLAEVNAESPTADELERTIFLSMLLSHDSAESRIGARVLGQRFTNDDVLCDHIAERLLKASNPGNRIAADTVAWYVNTLRDNCSPRYRDTLTLARQRNSNEKVIKYLDLALAVPVTVTVEQYVEGTVDLVAREAELKQQLGTIGGSSESARGFKLGSSLGEVVQRAGFPQDMTSLTLRIARYGRKNVFVAHYSGAGMLMFHRPPIGRWELGDTFDELYPVSETYKGEHFGIAQSLACLRGEMFREYVKAHVREIRQDGGLLWALANRLRATPFPADRYEEDGMLVGVKVIAASGHAEALDMLRQIGAAPGDEVPEAARDHAKKLARNAARTQAANQ